MWEIKQEDYEVSYDSESHTIVCQGTFRLRGTEYTPITEKLNDIATEQPEKIILNLRDLKFLNSSGINMLSKFIIRVRNTKVSHIIVQGNETFPWQRKSLKNLQRLMPQLQLEWTS